MGKLLRSLFLGIFLAALVIGPAWGAWPLTPLTTYVANSTPAIKAADLNAMQDAIVRVIGGTYSIKGIAIDGTGGNVVSAAPGSLSVSRVSSGIAVPTTSTPKGELSASMVPLCWGRFDSTGSIIRGANIFSATRTALGRYSVVCNTVITDHTSASAIATSGSLGVFVATSTDNGGGGKIRVNLSSGTAFADLDTSFHIVVFGD